MNIGALIIGDEILSGKRQDKHLPHVITTLAARGLSLDFVHYLGDDRQRLTALLRDSFARGDLLFSFGGIGATPDDHTRQAAAAALGGMIVPAGIFAIVNVIAVNGSVTGWGIPMATDIAFALAVLAVVGRRLPVALRAFLLTLAVVDDLGAIL